MEIVRKYLVVLVLIVIVAIVWIGTLFVTKQQFVPVNPNAASYTKPLKPDFDNTTLEKIQGRTENSYPILPSEFFELGN